MIFSTIHKKNSSFEVISEKSYVLIHKKFLNNNALKKYSIIIKEVKLKIIIVLVSITSRVHKVSIKLL